MYWPGPTAASQHPTTLWVPLGSAACDWPEKIDAWPKQVRWMASWAEDAFVYATAPRDALCVAATGRFARGNRSCGSKAYGHRGRPTFDAAQVLTANLPFRRTTTGVR